MRGWSQSRRNEKPAGRGGGCLRMETGWGAFLRRCGARGSRSGGSVAASPSVVVEGRGGSASAEADAVELSCRGVELACSSTDGLVSPSESAGEDIVPSLGDVCSVATMRSRAQGAVRDVGGEDPRSLKVMGVEVVCKCVWRARCRLIAYESISPTRVLKCETR